MTWALAAACAVASVPALLRWLRVAQREHYLAPAVTRFAARWWAAGPVNRGLGLASAVGLAATPWVPPAGFLVAAAQAGPIGLPVRGVTSPLAWTPRLRRLATLVGATIAAAYLAGALTSNAVLIVAVLFLSPLVVDGWLVLLGPLEQALGQRWVTRAARRLASVGPEVVAITGSYGKTTTKGYVAHLLEGSRRVVASPASFNNRMGLARAINEHLTPGTEVFVAEMGTYGPGEIEQLCRWIPPKVAAIVALGPVHLERFGSLERILEAKSEILQGAEVGVLCVDHPMLHALAGEKAAGMQIIEVSSGPRPARVEVGEGGVTVDGARIADTPPGVFASNLAAALGICLALGVEPGRVSDRIPALPRAEHRQTVAKGETGVAIIDDTYNSNPEGAKAGLALLSEVGRAGTKAVVTPGMVELGPVQASENRAFAALAAQTADHLLVVGHTNRRALLEGADGGRAAVTVVDTREGAVEWVRSNLGDGDAVLYENDLPDHYP